MYLDKRRNNTQDGWVRNNDDDNNRFVCDINSLIIYLSLFLHAYTVIIYPSLSRRRRSRCDINGLSGIKLIKNKKKKTMDELLRHIRTVFFFFCCFFYFVFRRRRLGHSTHAHSRVL